MIVIVIRVAKVIRRAVNPGMTWLSWREKTCSETGSPSLHAAASQQLTKVSAQQYVDNRDNKDEDDDSKIVTDGFHRKNNVSPKRL